MIKKSILNFVTALHCEAKPIISHFKLKKWQAVSLSFPVFANADHTIFLIISGVGKVKMASAATLLFMLSGQHSFTSYLNIGIAGSTEFPLGEAVLANKITEKSTQRCWYPFVSPLHNMLQTHLMTHDTPQEHYPEKGMLDMEGSAFFQTANTFVTQEQIYVLKIISDNPQQHHHTVNVAKVQDIISRRIPEIETVSHHLMRLSNKESELQIDLNQLTQFQNTWHFTHSQTIQLKEYLRCWNVKLNHVNPFHSCLGMRDAKHVINKLMSTLEEKI